MNCSPPGFSVHGILQARRLEWVATPFSRGVFPTQGLNLGNKTYNIQQKYLCDFRVVRMFQMIYRNELSLRQNIIKNSFEYIKIRNLENVN